MPLHERRSDGPLVLWVHGYTLDGSVWAPVWDQLPQFSHLAPDLPGHGLADAPASGLGLFGACMDCVEGIARGEGARLVVAMSFGGGVTLEVMARSPALFTHAVLAAPALPGGPVDGESSDCHLEILALARQRGLGPWLADRWLSSPPKIFSGLRANPAAFAAIEPVVRRHGFAELLDGAMADMALRPPILPRLAKVQTATTLLVGEEDMAAFRRCAELLRRGLHGARRVWLPSLGHQPLLEDPAGVAAYVAEALCG